MSKILFRLSILLAVLLIAAPADAQRLKRTKTKKSIEKFDDTKEDQESAALRAQEDGRKAHVRLQEKEVRRRMRRSARKAKRQREGKRESFFSRLFRRK